MKYTDNYNLKLPESSDFIKVSDLSENFEIIDSVLGATRNFTASFPSNGWTGNAAPYTQTVACTGITATDKPLVCLSYPDSITSDNAEDYEEAFGYISKLEAGDGTLTATCLYEKPAMDISVEVRV